SEDTTIDEVGPETSTYRGLVESIGTIIGVKRPIVRVPPLVGYLVSRCLNPFVKDVIITRQEITGIMRNLLDSDAPPTAPTRLTDWAKNNRATLGLRYASEVARRIKREAAYEDL
ncbi:MAG: epimerase, partial [Planctomycetes bacterium]|nr:epimerase [Planctomycetota bacterium]